MHKLAAFYTIRNYMYPEHEELQDSTLHSYGSPPSGEVYLNSGTEFAEAINGKDADQVMDIIDEAMTALQVLNPPFYASIIRKLK